MKGYVRNESCLEANKTQNISLESLEFPCHSTPTPTRPMLSSYSSRHNYITPHKPRVNRRRFSRAHLWKRQFFTAL